MENNERGKSLVNYVPRGNNVLIRLEFEISILAISSGKPSSDDNGMCRFYVAGLGPLVKDLTLNEEIGMKLPEYSSVEIKGNNNSIRVLKEFYTTMKKSDLNLLIAGKDNKVNVVEYALFPEFMILGHIE